MLTVNECLATDIGEECLEWNRCRQEECEQGTSGPRDARKEEPERRPGRVLKA
jgi:hypothetical protein